MRISRLLLIPTVLLAAACAKEPVFDDVEIGSDGRIPLNIDGSISQVHTKATASGFVDKDAVGLYAVNYTADNTVPGVLAASGNQADNAKYIFDESGHKWNPVKPVYYKDVNTNVDLYVYYPYIQGISEINAYGFEVQKDQSAPAAEGKLSGYEASDWMWGKTESVTPTESRISVPLKHKLSAVQVVLNEGSGFGEGEFASLDKNVIVTNTTRKAQLNFADGSVTAVGAAQVDGIVMCLQTDGSFRAIVVPQTVTAGSRLFSITVNGISYGFKQNTDVIYQAGKQLVVNININKKTPTGEFEFILGSCDIVDWTEDLNTHGGEARQYYVVNVTEPGKLGKLIKAAGKNPDKIRNLKVTGTVTTEDFYFMRDSMAILEAINMKESRVVHGLVKDSWVEIDKIYEDDVIPYEAFIGKQTLYYYVFPEIINRVGEYAFSRSSLSGTLYIPDDCKIIDGHAFENTNITSLKFGNKLEVIGNSAFSVCRSLSGTLLLPESLTEIGRFAFEDASFSGSLHLPDGLSLIGDNAFRSAGHFDGDLIIPSNISELYGSTFAFSKFSGSLTLNNVSRLEQQDFLNCELSGELVLPENLQIIPNDCFGQNNFSSIVFPKTIKKIGSQAFSSNGAICNSITIPEDCLIIEARAFIGCSNIPSVSFPGGLQIIQESAFSGCYGISKMVSNASEPPTVFEGAFDGVGKDNLTLEVPAQSLIKYQTENGWSDFKRISAYQDFSVSRRQMRALNAECSNTYVLRAPSGQSWSIESKPDWVTVAPSSGTGKAEITVTVSAMAHSDATFSPEVWVNGYYDHTDTYKGRMGDIIFLLNDKDYRFTMSVEQYDYDYSDCEILTLQTANSGSGIDVVLIGDGYDAKDIAMGKYLNDIRDAYTAFFAVEPYVTYKEYFNVKTVFALSKESGIGTINTKKDSRFGSIVLGEKDIQRIDDVFSYARLCSSNEHLQKGLILLVANDSASEGKTFLYGDGSSIALCPKSTMASPYDFRGIVQHEAGGHAFGKLADENIVVNRFIPDDVAVIVKKMKADGWYENIELTEDMHQVGWAHLLFHPSYSDVVDVYEGGYYYSRGVFRSEPVSCMNNNIPYFSAISRQAIVERILEYSGEGFTLDKFYAKDKSTVGVSSIQQSSVHCKYDIVGWCPYGHEHGPVYMGEHPNLK